ncbi:MAG: TM1802 family CRISPR-associated protein [Nitrosotalea sp.]
MLDSIYKIGLSQEEGTEFADDPNVKQVIGISFVRKNGTVKYDSVKLSEFQDKSLYLYRKDSSGKPGLFLSGSVAQNDVKNIINSLGGMSEKKIVEDFIEKKIMWFPRGKLIKDKNLSELTQQIRKDLDQIFSELESNKKKIGQAIISIFKESKPQKYLITIKLPHKDDSTFVGQIKECVSLFNKGVLSKKTASEQKMICTVCNKSSVIESFTESPLPFYYADKITFFPNIDDSQRNKGFALCDQCNLEIQKGLRYIKKFLDYRIPSLDKKSGNIRFWLVPHLNDVKWIKKLEREQQNKSLYLNELKDLCSTIKRITKFETGSKDVNSFLRFSSLFYFMDENGRMRITDYVPGIFPEQLQKLLNVKKSVDQKFPYEKISTKIKKLDLIFGFPLIPYFFKDNTPQWEEQVVELLENIFTGRETNKLLVLQVINEKIRESWKSQDSSVFHDCLRGLMLLEYLIRLENNQELEPMSSISITPQIELVEKFLAEHAEVLSDNNSQAAFGTGVCVGILLEVQVERYHKVAPFWSRLNRLDLDLDRVKELFPQVKSYLAMYGVQEHDTIINFIGATQISKLDPSKQIHKEQLNFAFSLGMSVGYLIKRDYLK